MDNKTLAMLAEQMGHKLLQQDGVGGVIGVYAGAQSHLHCFGRSGTGRPIDEQSIFPIGSITKVFTSTLLAQMVCVGEVNMSTVVGWKIPAHLRITLGDLATHTSGLPRLPGNMSRLDPKDPYSGYTVAMLIEYLKQCVLEGMGEYRYSNLGMAILGHALAYRLGMSYEQALVQHVLEPLGLRDTRAVVSEPDRNRLVQGYNAAGPTCTWSVEAFEGAGGLTSTGIDMLRFLEMNLVPDSSVPPLLRHALGFARLSRHQVQGEQEAMSANGVKTESIALGWHLIHLDSGREVVWHNGRTGGFSSYLGFMWAQQLGVIILSNYEHSDVTTYGLGFELLQSLSQG